jgi:hypothetical protein
LASLLEIGVLRSMDYRPVRVFVTEGLEELNEGARGQPQLSRGNLITIPSLDLSSTLETVSMPGEGCLHTHATAHAAHAARHRAWLIIFLNFRDEGLSR